MPNEPGEKEELEALSDLLRELAQFTRDGLISWEEAPDGKGYGASLPPPARGSVVFTSAIERRDTGQLALSTGTRLVIQSPVGRWEANLASSKSLLFDLADAIVNQLSTRKTAKLRALTENLKKAAEARKAGDGASPAEELELPPDEEIFGDL